MGEKDASRELRWGLRMLGIVVVISGLLVGQGCLDLMGPVDEEEEAAGVRVEVSPSSVNLMCGGTQQFAAIVQNGSASVASSSVTWWATGGTIDAEGLYQAGEVPGMYRVIATESSGVADTATVGLSMMGSDLVSDVSPASYQLGRLTVGERYYTDRDYTVRDVSAQFEDWVLIRTANADKNNGSASFLSFDLSATATVAVAYDKRATSLPGWLAEWTSAGSGLTVSDGSASPMPIRVRSFPAGRVVLGGNASDGAAGAQSMYVVFVKDTAVSGGEDPVLTTVEVVPASATLQTNGTRQFTAVARDQYGAPMAGSFSWSATGGSVTPEGFYTAGGVTGTYQVVATESAGRADTAAVHVVEPGNSPPAWFEEDFSYYDSHDHLMSDPRGIYKEEDDLQIRGRFVLDVDEGGPGFTKSLRQDFYAFNGNCVEPAVGRKLIWPEAGSEQTAEVWLELYIKFSVGWKTDWRSETGCTGNPDHKTLFIENSESNRWAFHVGQFGTRLYGQAHPWEGFSDGQTGADVRAQVMWDGEWHRVRLHLRASVNGRGGIYEAWVDDIKIFEHLDIDSGNASGHYFKGFRLGANINIDPAEAQSFWWGPLKVWIADPGW